MAAEKSLQNSTVFAVYRRIYHVNATNVLQSYLSIEKAAAYRQENARKNVPFFLLSERVREETSVLKKNNPK